jgi:hypothetical protein
VTRDDIIHMARECQLIGMRPHLDGIYEKALERFAALVAAAECEKVARWIIHKGYATGHGDTIEDLLTELEWQVAEREREACAKICEEATLKNWFAEDCVALIRERGEV